MSNAPSDSRNPGQKRRRRNRGGQNRNNQGQNPGGRPEGQGHQGPNRRSGNHQERGPRERRQPEPVKLTFWQKLLKAIGLYKEPVRPPRPERAERPERTPRDARQPREGREPKGERPVKANIRIARSESPRKEFERGPVESPRLYVGNLSYDVSESDLSDLFKGIGGVRNVEIVYNRNTHRSKGYAFVEMLHVDDAKRAVEVFHDQPFMGRKMNVSGAKSKGQDEREEQEDREEQKPRPVVVAPLPAAVAATPAVVAEAAAVEETPAAEPAAEAPHEVA